MSRIATPYCSNELVEGSHEVAHVAGALLVRGHELRQRVKDDEVGADAFSPLLAVGFLYVRSDNQGIGLSG
jgi:hypothetical protein